MKTVLSFMLCLAIMGLGAGVVVTVNALWPKETVLASAEDRPRVNVHVKVLQPEQVEDVLLLTGRIDPWEERVISAEVAGKVEWQGIEEGDVFARGQEILKIDTAWYVAAHEQAQAQSELAAQELERMQGLKRGGVSSPQDLDRAVTQKKVASSDVVASSTQLEKAVVRAPMAGVVDKLHIKKNEWADRGQPLVRLVQVDKVKAIIGIPERDVSRLTVGDLVAITLDALPGASFQGKIFRIATSADRLTRTFNTEVELDNAERLLKPGMTVRARFVRDTFPDAIAVPIFSVISVENQRFAAIEENGVARVRPIEVGILQGDRVQVTQGLQAGERLIVAGQHDVHDGEPVNVMEVRPE